jgi:two-component system, chemotaxis family, CheB/CheR fusion protein
MRPSGESERLASGASSATGELDFVVVGIGASAGGLAAFEDFFSALPSDLSPGLAFVLVQHLSPDHKSSLVKILQRHTQLPVHEVTDGMTVNPNCVYIIPPDRDMALLHGKLTLVDPEAPRGQRLPVDFLFRSLAREIGERAIAVVLSGNGSDGTQGARLIKSEGGVVLAQRPDSTEYPAMPDSVIKSGVVDLEMLPSEMPARILEFASVVLSREDAPEDESESKATDQLIELLRLHTGHDFSQYKPSTFLRRVGRRLVVNRLNTLDSYVKVARRSPDEVQALFRDLLIGVTSFFRDPESFRHLAETALREIVASKLPGAPIRVWVPGCSTGEEAYTLAILLLETRETMNNVSKIQIFATDIDDRAIAKARVGRFPESISGDVSAERLADYFTAEPGIDGQVGHYLVNKNVRDLVIFSEQDLLRDPPFSKLDLISCRNLLIYFDQEMQKRIIPIFHYALESGGFLFLGGSESVGLFDDLFTEEESRCRIFRRSPQNSSKRRLLPTTFQLHHPGGRKVPGPALETVAPSHRTFRELMEKELLGELKCAAALVDENGNILFLHGRTGQYLEPAPGEFGVNNILVMARDGLARPLTAAMHAATNGKVVRRTNVKVKSNGNWSWINLTVRPSAGLPELSPNSRLYLILFEPTKPPKGKLPKSKAPGKSGGQEQGGERIRALEEQLLATEEFLQAVTEELRTSNEELRTSNEEMQSINEELQSTNEELETSKEELQSLNEELSTVNAELENKIADLSRINNDMNNLLAGTGIGTLFLDLQLRILRFTPSATRIINLIPTDVGRPISHLVANLVDYSELMEDVKSVLDTLKPVERIVSTRDGEWYAIQMMPYRTLDNVVEGAVLTFVSVDRLKKMEQDLRKTEHYWRAGLKAFPVTLSVQDDELRYLWVYSDEGSWLDQMAIGRTDFDLLSKADAESLSALKKSVLQSGDSLCQRIDLKRGDKTYSGELRVEAITNCGSDSTEIATSFVALEDLAGNEGASDDG